MESAFLTFLVVSSFAVYSSHTGITDCDDVVVTREGMPTTLICNDTAMRGAVAVNWSFKPVGADGWKLVLSATENKKFSGSASKATMQLTDPNFQETGDFSLFLLPKAEDGGLYTCLIKQQEKALKKTTILLAILKVSVFPAAPIPQYSILRLIARVIPGVAISNITWTSPGGIPMKSEKRPNTGTVAKLPQVLNNDNGAYVCMVHPWGKSSHPLFAFNVEVTIAADKVASLRNITHDTTISTAAEAHTSLLLKCPHIQGDLVRLHWAPPNRRVNLELVFEYDRWRGSTVLTEKSKRLRLAGPPYNPEAGSFSFLLSPQLNDGGLFACEVFLNDNIFSQRTVLTVMRVKTRQFATKLELLCQYKELSQVQSAKWTHHNKSHQLQMLTNHPGSISTMVPLPITSDTAGNYTCTIQLKNGQVVMAANVIRTPTTEHVSVATPSLLPSLSALLLLVLLVAAAVGALLWRQKHNSDRGIEQSLSVRSGEAENIYENPEDIRQGPPQGSVYMDLKPRAEDDVYKELE
ncbi:g6f-like [Pholidichthys leucotaenia]